MVTTENKNSVEWSLSPTSITLKRGTKRLLDSVGAKRETYDEIIRRLARENKLLKSQIPKRNKENKLILSNYKRKSSSQSFSERKIFFEFTVPEKNLQHFRFDIRYTKIVKKERVTKSNQYDSPLEMAKEYLMIYEKLLKKYIDPLFCIDQRRIIDLDWWRRKLSNLGLSDDTYRADIEEQLIHMGVLP